MGKNRDMSVYLTQIMIQHIEKRSARIQTWEVK